MKRILPKQVLEAYRETKTIPITHSFLTERSGKTHCCGIGAVALDKYCNSVSVFEKQTGLDVNYINCFLAGFDGDVVENKCGELTDRHVQGYIDGINAHILVANHFDELVANANGAKS